MSFISEFTSLKLIDTLCIKIIQCTQTDSSSKGKSQFLFRTPLPLSFARSRESKGCPNSGFDRGVGLRGRGRYPLKPSIPTSLLETKGYPEHTAARSSRESHKCTYFRLK